MNKEQNRYARTIDKLGFWIDVRYNRYDYFYFYLIDKNTKKRITKTKNYAEYFPFHTSSDVEYRITNKNFVKRCKPYYVARELCSVALEYRKSENLAKAA